MTAKTLMIQGTTSDAGKSTLVAGLCRILKNRGQRVVPFKPQNMALNSAVTPCGGEIGRAQAVQAQAAGLVPHPDMNPVLIKPSSDTGAQIIIHGQVYGNMSALEYHAYKRDAIDAVMDSYHRLQQQYDWIIVEGAGSPAEINLRDNDIANMGFAERADCDVVIVSDIDKGGVFAHLVGTLALLSESEQRRTRGFIINRFRGDLDLLIPGLEWLEQHTAKPVFGVLPYIHGLHLEAEDAIKQDTPVVANANCLKIIVPVFPHISNHTDLDPLRLHPDVDLQFVAPALHNNHRIPAADLVILPGSKNVRADLDWLRQQGWEDYLIRHLRYGGKLIGLCGGFQMLGQTIDDPHGVEGPAGSSRGLQLLDFSTTLESAKILKQSQACLAWNQACVEGYEIHMGLSEGPALQQPALLIDNQGEGVLSADGQILGTYVHGLFDHPEALLSLLQWAGMAEVESLDYQQLREQHLDQLAAEMENHLDIDALLSL